MRRTLGRTSGNLRTLVARVMDATSDEMLLRAPLRDSDLAQALVVFTKAVWRVRWKCCGEAKPAEAYIVNAVADSFVRFYRHRFKWFVRDREVERRCFLALLKALPSDSTFVYTDGSSYGNPGPAGSAYAIFEGRTLAKEGAQWLGIATNGYAEVLGILGATRALLETSRPATRPIYIFVDNREAVRLAMGLSDALWCADEVAEIRANLTELARRSPVGVTFHWVPGHADVEGNELVDKAAKRAAKSRGVRPPPPEEAGGDEAAAKARAAYSDPYSPSRWGYWSDSGESSASDDSFGAVQAGTAGDTGLVDSLGDAGGEVIGDGGSHGSGGVAAASALPTPLSVQPPPPANSGPRRPAVAVSPCPLTGAQLGPPNGASGEMSVAYSGPYSPSRWGYWSDDDEDLESGDDAHGGGPFFDAFRPKSSRPGERAASKVTSPPPLCLDAQISPDTGLRGQRIGSGFTRAEVLLSPLSSAASAELCGAVCPRQVAFSPVSPGAVAEAAPQQAAPSRGGAADVDLRWRDGVAGGEVYCLSPLSPAIREDLGVDAPPRQTVSSFGGSGGLAGGTPRVAPRVLCTANLAGALLARASSPVFPLVGCGRPFSLLPPLGRGEVSDGAASTGPLQTTPVWGEREAAGRATALVGPGYAVCLDSAGDPAMPVGGSTAAALSPDGSTLLAVSGPRGRVGTDPPKFPSRAALLTPEAGVMAPSDPLSYVLSPSRCEETVVAAIDDPAAAVLSSNLDPLTLSHAGPVTAADAAPVSLPSWSAGLGVRPEASAEMVPPPLHSPSPSGREWAADGKGEPPAPLGAIRSKALRDVATADCAHADPSPPRSLVAPRAGSLSLSPAWSPSRREGVADVASGAEGPSSAMSKAVVTPATLSRRERAADCKGKPSAPLGAICPIARRGVAATGPALAGPSPLQSLAGPRAGFSSLSAAWSPSRREGAAEAASGAEGPSRAPSTAVDTPAPLSPSASRVRPGASAGASPLQQLSSPPPSRREGATEYDRKGEPSAPLRALRPSAMRSLVDLELAVVEGPAPPELERGTKAAKAKCVACTENLKRVRTNINLVFAKYRRKKRRSIAPQIDVRPEHKYNTRSRAKRTRNLQRTRPKRPRSDPSPGDSVSPGPVTKRSRQPSPPPQGTDIVGCNFPT